MDYYLDTAVWIAIIDKKHQAHATAARVFAKAERIAVSFSHYVELSRLGFGREYEHRLRELGCICIEQTERERRAAYKLNSETDFGYGDCLHILCAKKAGAIAISPDKHWHELGQALGVEVIHPKDFA